MSEVSGSPDLLQTVIDLLPEATTRKSHDLARWGVSQGVGLAVASLSEALLSHSSEDSDEAITTSRNSAARQASAGPLEHVVGVIDKFMPNITPSDITKAGKTMVEGASALIIARPDHPVVATTLYTGGSLLDTVDGFWARHRGLDCPDGMIEDVEADLEQQLATFSALSITAMRRGNRVAAANYALTTMLTPLSAYTRAQAETRGLIVSEGGLGTRVGRGIMGGVGMAMNRHSYVSDAVSATLAVGTANTVWERRDVALHGSSSEHCIGTNEDPDFAQEAELRLDAIRPYAEAGLAVGSVLLGASMLEKAV